MRGRYGAASMSDELEKAKTRLAHGRLLLEQQKTHVAHLQSRGDPAVQSKKLIKNMELTIAGMEKYLTILRKTPRL